MSLTPSNKLRGSTAVYILKNIIKLCRTVSKKISNKTIFYLVYSPPEQCAHNKLEFELESKLNVSGFEPTACDEWV